MFKLGPYYIGAINISGEIGNSATGCCTGTGINVFETGISAFATASDSCVCTDCIDLLILLLVR